MDCAKTSVHTFRSSHCDGTWLLNQSVDELNLNWIRQGAATTYSNKPINISHWINADCPLEIAYELYFTVVTL